MILYMILSKRSLPTGSFLVITKPLLKLRMCEADWMCMITDDMETALKQMGRRKKKLAKYWEFPSGGVLTHHVVCAFYVSTLESLYQNNLSNTDDVMRLYSFPSSSVCTPACLVSTSTSIGSQS